MSETKELALMPVAEVKVLADTVAKSRLFKGFEAPEAAFTLMMICQAEGVHPMKAMRRYDVIQGRPAMKADAMLADFMARGGRVKWIKNDHTECSAEFTSPATDGVTTVTWTVEDAKRAGLLNKDNWRGYTRQMLRARVVSEGVRMTDPGVVAGVYTPEEVADFDDKPSLPPVRPEVAQAIAASKPAEQHAPAETRPATRNWKPDTKEAAPTTSPKAPVPQAATDPTSGASTAHVQTAAAPSDTKTPGGRAPNAASSSEPAALRLVGEVFPGAEREPGSDDGDDMMEPPEWMGEPPQDIAAMASKPPEAADMVECWERKMLPGGDFEWKSIGMHPRRRLDQNATLHGLKNKRGIRDEDSTLNNTGHDTGKLVKGWRTRLLERFNKESSADLSVKEAGILIEWLEGQVRKYGTVDQKKDRQARKLQDAADSIAGSLQGGES